MALIAVPVMVAVLASAFTRASHITLAEGVSAEFGGANIRVDMTNHGAEWLEDTLAEVDPDARFVSYRALYSRLGGRVGGAVSDIDLTNPNVSGPLSLTGGRAPDSDDEIVLTEHLADALRVEIGDVVSFNTGRLQDNEFRVVGLVSHPVLWEMTSAIITPTRMDSLGLDPSALRPTYLIDASDDYALQETINRRWYHEGRFLFLPDRASPEVLEEFPFLPPEWLTMMTEEEIEEVRGILASTGQDAAWQWAAQRMDAELPDLSVSSRTEQLQWTSDTDRAPLVGTAVAAVVLAEVAFIAGAAFATGTRRRLREIGLLGANGASVRHVRASVVGEGLVVGLSAGVAGSLLALGLLVVGTPTLQRFVARRIEDFPLHTVDVIGPILIAVVASVVAAWVPARTAAAVPTLTALQGRMPAHDPKRWVTPAGVALTGFGTLLTVVSLAAGTDAAMVVTVVGVVFMIGGVALLAGPLVAWVSHRAERFPVGSRIVLRDLGRQRGRAAAAVAATMVILLAPVTAMAFIEADQHSTSIYGLPEENRQILVTGRYSDSYDEVTYTEADLVTLRAAVPDAEIVEFDVIEAPVLYPAELTAFESGRTDLDGGHYAELTRISIANDDLLAMLGNPRLEDMLSVEGMALIGVEERSTSISIDGSAIGVTEVPVAVLRYSFPRVLITASKADELGLEASGTYALAETDASLFGDPFEELYYTDLHLRGGTATPRGLMLAGILVATLLIMLIVVAIVTALSGTEADQDIQTIMAVGATNTIRRRYLGLVSAIQTLLGALLAVPLALLLVKAFGIVNSYEALGSFGTHNNGDLYVPWAGIGILVIGLPLVVGALTALSVRSAPLEPPVRVG